jgi:hypothetical protein
MGVGVTALVTDGRGVSGNEAMGLGLTGLSGPRRPRTMARTNAKASAPTAIAATIRRDRGFIAG